MEETQQDFDQNLAWYTVQDADTDDFYSVFRGRRSGTFDWQRPATTFHGNVSDSPDTTRVQDRSHNGSTGSPRVFSAIFKNLRKSSLLPKRKTSAPASLSDQTESDPTIRGTTENAAFRRANSLPFAPNLVPLHETQFAASQPTLSLRMDSGPQTTSHDAIDEHAMFNYYMATTGVQSSLSQFVCHTCGAPNVVPVPRRDAPLPAPHHLTASKSAMTKGAVSQSAASEVSRISQMSIGETIVAEPISKNSGGMLTGSVEPTTTKKPSGRPSTRGYVPKSTAATESEGPASTYAQLMRDLAHLDDTPGNRGTVIVKPRSTDTCAYPTAGAYLDEEETEDQESDYHRPTADRKGSESYQARARLAKSVEYVEEDDPETQSSDQHTGLLTPAIEYVEGEEESKAVKRGEGAHRCLVSECGVSDASIKANDAQIMVEYSDDEEGNVAEGGRAPRRSVSTIVNNLGQLEEMLRGIRNMVRTT